MLSASVLGPFLVAVLIICLAPGPDLAFVMASGLSGGRRGAVLAATGVSLGVTIWMLLTAFGLGALMTEFPQLSLSLRVAGALYLAHLAWSTWRGAGDPVEGAAVVVGRRMFWQGTATNLANPKMVLFFSAFLPQFVDEDRGSTIAQFISLGLILQAVGYFVDCCAGLAAGAASSYLGRNPQARRRLDRAAAIVFAVLVLAVVADIVAGR
jgi:threonine/homoserine/homoserine lactone efflux protein